MTIWQIEPEMLKPPIIDIGAGTHLQVGGPLRHEGVTPWDKEQGDATFMKGVTDESYQTVYSHHCLEHLQDPILALRNWWRILKRGGYMLRTLPSIFNSDHRTMWLLDRADPPNTFSLLDTVKSAAPDAYLISLRLVREGYVPLGQTQQSPNGFHAEGAWLKL